MKKILFGTTALLAAASFSASAEASDPIKLGVGGNMSWWVAAADQDSDNTTRVNNVDVQSDVTVEFSGETTLDNGMTVGAVVELAGTEAHDDPIGDVYMYLSGKYGKLYVGSTDDAAVMSAVMAPSMSELGAAGDGSDLERFLLNPVDTLEVAQSQTGSAPKLTYFTPRMYGLQAGVSFVPSGDEAGDKNFADIKTNGSWDQAWAFALNYEGEFEGVGIAAAATYALTDDQMLSHENNAIQNIGGGLNLSYEGFTFGGGVMRQISNENTSAAAADGFAWNVGLSYEEGPYGVSATYYRSSVEGNRAHDKYARQDDEVTEYQLAGTYALGAGVKMFAEIDYMDADNDAKVVKGGDPDHNEGAIGGAVGLALSF